MDHYNRRIIDFGVHVGSIDGLVLFRMFNEATSGHDWPTYLSSDNDPLFLYHRWKANLRILDIDEIKSLPHVPMSHPLSVSVQRWSISTNTGGKRIAGVCFSYRSLPELRFRQVQVVEPDGIGNIIGRGSVAVSIHSPTLPVKAN